LARWGFVEFEAALKRLTENYPPLKAVEELTQILDHLVGWDTGGKDRGALIHQVREHINLFLDRVNGGSGCSRDAASARKLKQPEETNQMLVVDARGFLPEG